MPSIDKRSSWKDEFNIPSVADLRGDLPAIAADLFDASRAGMLEFDALIEQPKWFGDCWFWTLAYFLQGEATKEDKPLALIIPATEDLQIAAPLDEEFLGSLNTRRMKRAVRDGLELSTPPYSTRWAIWSIPAPNMLEDVMQIVKQRLAWMRGT